MVNNIPVNGWPQLKDLEAVQPTLDRLDKIEAWKRTVKEDTFTGEEITIENALALPARLLITEINAIQEGEGDPSPTNIRPISGRTAVVLTRSDGDEISEDFTIQLGTTVYGAEINWDTGVMTVTDGAVDLGNLTWSAVNGSRFLSVNEMPNVKIDTSVSAPRNAICSQYVWKKGGDLFNLDDAGFSYYIEGGENRLFVKDLRYSDAASFKAAMSGVTLVYELATPTTIQLTPAQLEMLKGYNHITLSDGYGTIELKALTGANWS